MTRKSKLIMATAASVLLLGAAGGGWFWKVRGPVIKDIALDIKAGVRSRHAEKPFERYLELRYGSMSDPANRQKAFTGFFDSAHIQGMRRLVSHMNGTERQKNISATAEWIAKYRTNMSDSERQALGVWLQSDQGHKDIQQASVLYRSHDITYRAATESVIRELMVTLATVKQEEARK